MATVASNPSIPHHPHSSSSENPDNILPRSPWNQISEPVDMAFFVNQEILDNVDRDKNTVTKPAIMDVVWPSLSSATVKLSSETSSESSKCSIDGLNAPQLQDTGSTHQVSNNASANNVSTNQKLNEGNNSNTYSNGGHPQKSAPHGSMATIGTHHNSSLKDHQPRSGGSVSHDYPQHRNSFRSRNGGQHQRGDGAYHRNYGSRRDQNHGNHNQDWHTHRNFYGTNTYIPPGAVPIMRPPPPVPSYAAHFIPPPFYQPFGGPIGFQEPGPSMVYQAPPLDPLMTPLPYHYTAFPPAPASDPQLHAKIVKQIDYYFSVDNLIKDMYLRKNMDDQGWVPIRLIAGFNRVKHLTNDIRLILEAVQTSSIVEVKGNKIRRRNDWKTWIWPLVEFPHVASLQTLGNSSHDMLAEQVQRICLETTTNNDGSSLLSNSEGNDLAGI